jgi:LmbE family N-acetylglucosaminyl deacetylase
MNLEPNITTPMRILVICAHPDDIEIGCGGSVARWTDAGAQVTFVLVTDGAAGGNEPGTNYTELAKKRKEEQRAAAKIVGVEDIRFLDYADGTVEPTIALRRDLTRIIRQVRPQRVVITDPTTVLLTAEGSNYINHPDHQAVATAALYAVFPSAGARPIFPELLREGLEPLDVEELYMHLTEKPNLAVDISAVHERKVQAVLCHRSQLGEEAGEWMKKWDGESGKAVGVEYAEMFRVMTFKQPEATKDDIAD